MIYTTKGLVSKNDYILGIVVAILLLIFGAMLLISNSNLFAYVIFCGVAVFLVIISSKIASVSKSYISVYVDHIEGVSISRCDSIITIKYEDVNNVTISEDLNKIIVYDKYGSFTFQAQNCAKKVADMIYEQQRGICVCPRCQKKFSQAFCPICGYIAPKH